MGNRIEVQYDNGANSGALRYLDVATGRLFKSAGSVRPVNSGFLDQREPGVWLDKVSGHRVRAVRPVGCTGTPPNPALSDSSPYPDGNPKSLQGAKKFSLRYLPLPANIAVNQALEDGAKKYGPANWREKGVACSVYIDAALRHVSQYFDGKQNNASDSGVHNLGHAMACLAIIIDAEANGTLTDDRPFPCKDTDTLLLRS